ncbi:MAG: beta-N-acetylhexosaminidase [Vicinamibacterales bacterium]
MPLPLRRRLGQLLFGSFPGRTVSVELRALAREFDLGGVTLFARNVEAPEQVLELAGECAALGRERPAWVSVDQEGGRVARLRAPFTVWPPMATLGRAGSAALTARFARALAAELRAVGVTLDFAPVLDVLTNASNPVIGDRALSDDAAVVGDLGAAVVRELQAAGVAACGKHFPGHGDTLVDSHHGLPVVEHPPERLQAIEFAPFRAAIAADVAFLMTAHVLVPAFDEAWPATLSAPILARLRDELGFGGAILSDDLEMQAVRARWEPAEAAVRAVAAGCDGVLVCSGDAELLASTCEGLVRAVESGALPSSRADDALARMQRAKQRFLPPTAPAPAWKAVVGCEAHQRVAAEMAGYL